MSAVPLSEVGRRGRMNLRFGCHSGKTVLSDAYCEVPFKITRLQQSDGMAHLILMQSTAGLFGGDDVSSEIHVESGARILITQQSATKIHPLDGKLAVQRNLIRVDSDAVLHLYYEPLIPFAGSRARQETSIELESGARLFFWESLMAGRIARGEVWQFDELSSETSLRVNGRMLYLDRFRLRPRAQTPASEWMMGSNHYLATALCYDPCASELAPCLHHHAPTAGIDMPAPDLLAARFAAADGPEFHRYRTDFMSRFDLGLYPQTGSIPEEHR